MQTTPKKTVRFDTLEVKHEQELSKSPSSPQPKNSTYIATKLVSEQTLLEIRRKKESRKEEEPLKRTTAISEQLRERSKETAVRETMGDDAASGCVQKAETRNAQARPAPQRETTEAELRNGWSPVLQSLSTRSEAGGAVVEDKAVKRSQEHDKTVGNSVHVKATTPSTAERRDKEQKPAVKMLDKESDKDSDEESNGEESNEESSEEPDEECAQRSVLKKRGSTSTNLEARLDAGIARATPPALRPHDPQRLPNLAGAQPDNTSAMPALSTRASLKAPASVTTMKDVKHRALICSRTRGRWPSVALLIVAFRIVPATFCMGQLRISAYSATTGGNSRLGGHRYIP